MGKNLAVIKLKRSSRGMEIYIKSELIEARMQSLGDSQEIDSDMLAGVTEAYPLNSYRTSEHTQRDGLNRPLVNTDTARLNVSYLTIKGVGQGITLHYKPVVSVSQIQEWKAVISQGLKELLNELGPFEINITADEAIHAPIQS